MEHQETYYYTFFFHKVFFCFQPNIGLCVLSINLSNLKQEAPFAEYLLYHAKPIFYATRHYALFQFLLM